MQLQGELVKGGGEKVYKNAIDVLAKTYRNEGIRGVQRGLGAAVSLHIFISLSRVCVDMFARPSTCTRCVSLALARGVRVCLDMR